MKLIIDCEATLENNSDIDVKVVQTNHHKHLYRKHHFTSQATRGSLPSK